MAESTFEAFLLPPVREFLDALPNEDADEIQRLISIIELDPWADGRFKMVYYADPVTYTVYVHPRFRILYTIRPQGRIAIEGITERS